MENVQTGLHALTAVARMCARVIILVVLLPSVCQQVKAFQSAHALKGTLVILTSSASPQGVLKIQSARVTSNALTNIVITPVLRRHVLPIQSVVSQTT